MKTRFTLIVFLILTISCNKKEDDLYFYNFDEVDYYHKNISDNDLFAEYDKMKLPNYDNTYLKILQNEYPKDVNNSSFTNDLLKFGYTKKIIVKSKLNEINKIFSKKLVMNYQQLVVFRFTEIFLSLKIKVKQLVLQKFVSNVG